MAGTTSTLLAKVLARALIYTIVRIQRAPNLSNKATLNVLELDVAIYLGWICNIQINYVTM